MLHGVDTILLLFPDFTWPTNEFVERYEERVEGDQSLMKYGISMDHVKQALRWLTSRPNILLPSKVTLSMMDVVASKLVARRRGQMEFATHHGIEPKDVPSQMQASEHKDKQMHGTSLPAISRILGTRSQGNSALFPKDRRPSYAQHVVRDLVDPPAMSGCRVVAVVDPGDWEAVCAALLVREMLVLNQTTSLEKVPHVLSDDDVLPPNVEMVLVVCSTGCFHSSAFCRHVLSADGMGVRFIPIVAAEHFRFPVAKQFAEEMRHKAPAITDSGTGNLEDLVRVVCRIFEEIAIDVVLQDSEEVIRVRIEAIAARLAETRQRPQGLPSQSDGCVSRPQSELENGDKLREYVDTEV